MYAMADSVIHNLRPRTDWRKHAGKCVRPRRERLSAKWVIIADEDGWFNEGHAYVQDHRADLLEWRMTTGCEPGPKSKRVAVCVVATEASIDRLLRSKRLPWLVRVYKADTEAKEREVDAMFPFLGGIRYHMTNEQLARSESA